MKLKKSILCCLFLGCTYVACAQKDTADNYVNRFISIPSFKAILVPDSSSYSNEKLKKNTPFMVMFFSPDCDHCQKQTKELLAYKDQLKNLQILMLSALPHKYAKDFYDEYGLSSMPGIKLGNDANHDLNSIYRVRTFPSMYLYDNDGTLLKAFVGNIAIPAILDALK